jgi:HEPN domain-containing protein
MVHDRETFVDEVFGFHAQQAVEKALKAWLSQLGAEYPKTHDLDELFALLADSGGQVPAELSDLRDLADFAVQYRYEAFDEPLPIDREATVARVKAFVALAAAQVGTN